MLKGLYSSASALLAQQKRMDTVTNNLANASTVGYKRDTATTRAFEELLIERLNDGPTPAAVGGLGTGTYVDRVTTRVSTGPLRETGNPLHVAIMGDGFFTVQTPQGLRYTRAGNFERDGSGTLVTPAGHPVLVNGRPVSGETIEILETGEVLVDGRSAGRLDIRSGAGLRKQGNGLWVEDATSEVSIADEAFGLKVGFVEQSNVDPITEMVTLMTTLRAYEASQKLVQAQDQTLDKAVNEVGRV